MQPLLICNLFRLPKLPFSPQKRFIKISVILPTLIFCPCCFLVCLIPVPFPTSRLLVRIVRAALRALTSLFSLRNVRGRACADAHGASGPLQVPFITVSQFALLFTPRESGCEAGIIIMLHTRFALGLIPNSVRADHKRQRGEGWMGAGGTADK